MGWLIGWAYRKSVTLARASGAVTDYQMKLLVGESSGVSGEDVDCGGNCKTDFSDLRFTTSDGETLLPYWIESVSGSTPNQLATIWIKFNLIGTTDTTFYLYYGNGSATTYSSLDSAFRYSDSFEYPTYTATKLSDSQGSPEGLVFVNGYFYQAEQKSPTRIHELDPDTGAATGEYFDVADSTHMSALLWDGSYLWGCDYAEGKVYKINLASSLSTHVADIVGSFFVGNSIGFSGQPSAIAFVNYNSSTQMLITEWASSGAMIVVDYVSALSDGTVIDNILRTFYQCEDGDAPGRVQGIYSSSSDNYSNVFIATQPFSFSHTGLIQSVVRGYNFGDLENVVASSVIVGSDYYADERRFLPMQIYQQPTAYNGTIYICQETTDDLVSLAESDGYIYPGWSGTAFTASSDFSYEGSYSAKLVVPAFYANSDITINQGGRRLDVNVYPISFDEHIYIAVAEASGLTDRITIGVHGNSVWDYWDGSWHSSAVAINIGAWNTISFIANNAGNIKVLVNETQIYSGSRCDNINYLRLERGNGYGADALYVDAVRVRNYSPTEPVWGSWGSEEVEEEPLPPGDSTTNFFLLF